MPYASDAQRRFFNANRSELESQGVDVDEWNESSKGKDLPERAGKKKKKKKAAALDRRRGGAEWIEILTKCALGSTEKRGGCGDPSVLGPGGMQPARAGTTPPTALADLDAIKVAIAVNRRDRYLLGPERGLWLARRAEICKEGMAIPPTTGSAAVTGDPASAYQKLMSMISPRPTVPPAGTGLPTTTPGGEMGGRNTPSTNPIGLMSGLGVDPGGRSVMGNAAFGTRNAEKVAYGPDDSRMRDYYALSRARALRARSARGGSPMTLTQALGQTGMGRYPERQLGQAAPAAAPQGPRYSQPAVVVGNQRLTPEQMAQWQGLDRAGQRGMAQQILAQQRPAPAYQPQTAASTSAPTHDMTPPAGMTAQQSAVWEQRKGDPQWAARARAWLQRGQGQQAPVQQVSQTTQSAPPQQQQAPAAQGWRPPTPGLPMPVAGSQPRPGVQTQSLADRMGTKSTEAPGAYRFPSGLPSVPAAPAPQVAQAPAPREPITLNTTSAKSPQQFGKSAAEPWLIDQPHKLEQQPTSIAPENLMTLEAPMFQLPDTGRPGDTGSLQEQLYASGSGYSRSQALNNLLYGQPSSPGHLVSQGWLQQPRASAYKSMLSGEISPQEFARGEADPTRAFTENWVSGIRSRPGGVPLVDTSSGFVQTRPAGDNPGSIVRRWWGDVSQVPRKEMSPVTSEPVGQRTVFPGGGKPGKNIIVPPPYAPGGEPPFQPVKKGAVAFGKRSALAPPAPATPSAAPAQPPAPPTQPPATQTTTASRAAIMRQQMRTPPPVPKRKPSTDPPPIAA